MNSARGKPGASGSESEHSVDDIWDDTLIIRNYEESLAVVKEVVAKRLAMKTNKKQPGQLKIKTEEAAQEPGTSTATAAAQGPKSSPQDEGESSGVEGSTNGCTEKGASETGAKPEYKVGDCCRATYEDGVDYEAKILAVEKATGSALIRYIGYNNEQTVAIDDLVPSWGRKARRKQREDAAEEAAEADSHQMEISDDEEKLTKKASKIRINFDPSFARSPKRGGGGPAVNGFGGMGGGASFMVPPPPPMPPMLECDDDPESENLSAMLMSWYMSGYYTGLYHGQKMSQKRARPS